MSGCVTLKFYVNNKSIVRFFFQNMKLFIYSLSFKVLSTNTNIKVYQNSIIVVLRGCGIGFLQKPIFEEVLFRRNRF